MKANSSRWKLGLAAIIGLGFGLSGCGDGEGHERQLLTGVKNKASAEDERIQKLMQIRVWDNSSSTWTTRTAEDLIDSIPPAYRADHTGDTCMSDELREANNLSIAIHFNKIARSLVPIQLYNSTGAPTVRIPAQDHAARIALFYVARRAALRAMAYAQSALGQAVLAGDCNVDGQNQGERLVEVFSLAYDAYVDATNGAIDSTLITGDILRARAQSERDGRIWSYSAKEFSRSAAAHLITGGMPGWAGDIKFDPFCAAAPLKPTERRALELLRIAAPDPQDLANPDVSIKSLIGGAQAAGDGGATPASGTIVQRLAEFLPDPDLISSSADLATTTNLSLDDFVAARDYMLREYTSLMRTDETLPSPSTAAYARFAGTASDPKPLPDIAYVAASRYRYWGYAKSTIVDPQPTELESQGLDDLRYDSDPSLDEFNSQVALSLQAFIPDLESIISEYSPSEQNRLNAGTKQSLLDLMNRIAGQAWGAVAVGYANETETTADLIFDVETREPAADLWFIRGFDGLRCLLDGNVEGAACDLMLDGYRFYPSEFSENGADPTSLFGYRYRFAQSVLPNAVIHDPLFIVDNTSGTPKVVHSIYWAVSPNSKVSRGGKTLVFEESNRRVGKLLSLSGDWCGETRYDCLGNNVSDKLPLENELSKDELDMESSWKRYLDMAKQSGTEAELRGKEYIDAALQVELRKEEIWKDRDTRVRQAVEQIQEICGTSLDPARMLEFLKGGKLPAPASATCTTDTECNTAGQKEYYQCMAGQCVVDFGRLAASQGDSDPELARLAECVSSAEIPFVTPGDKPLCVWVNLDNVNDVCSGATSTMECPVLASEPTKTDPDEACAKNSKPSSAKWKLAGKDATLSYFTVKSGLGGSNSKQDIQRVCEDMRALRARIGGATRHGTGEVISAEDAKERQDEVKRSLLFHPDVFTENTTNWKFEVMPETNLRVLVNGVERWSTGRIGLDGTTSSPHWPCGSASRPADCSSTEHQASGITCDYVDCSDPHVRGDFVWRLLEAGHMMQLARRGGATGGVEVDSVPNPWLDKEPCDSGEMLLNRNTKTPLRFKKCSDGYSYLTTDGVTDQDRLVWSGSRLNYDLGSADGDTGTWVKSGSNGDVVLKQGKWINWFTQFAEPNSVDFGILNGLSDAADAAGSQVSPELPRLVMNTLEGIVPEGVEPVASTGPKLGDSSDPGKVALDALDLYCQGVADGGVECDANVAPPKISSAEQLPLAARYLQCIGDTISSRTGKMVLAKVPERAMDALRKSSALGSFPAVGGTYGAAVSRLRAALVELSDVGPAIASEIRQMGTDIEVIGATLKINTLQAQIADWQFMSSLSSAIASCGSSSTPWGAAATCANALAQTQFLSQINQLQQDVAEQNGVRDLAQFRSQLETRNRALATYGNRANAAMEQIDAQLAELEGLRLNARRHAAEVLYAAKSEAPNSEAINNAFAWKYQETRRRYEESTKVARNLAIIARRAIEQRLGVRLESLKDPLPLVDAPSLWVPQICEAEGLTFEDISATAPEEATSGGEAYKQFLGNFIAEYVSKLERTVESYRMSFPFQDGVDEAVVSVRNDLMTARAQCEVRSPNLVPSSGQLDQITGTGQSGSGWTVYNCASQTYGNNYAGCIGIQPELPHVLSGGETVQLYAVDFDLGKCQDVGCYSSGGLPNFGTAITLTPGWYALTYVSRETEHSTCPIQPALMDSSNQDVPSQGEPQIISYLDTNQTPLVRKVLRYYIDSNDSYKLQFRPKDDRCMSSSTGQSTAYLGEVMLSRQTQPDWAAQKLPAYMPTNAQGFTTIAACQDKSGAVFRQKNWSERKCMRLCEDGYSDACDERAGKLECYRELRFRLDESRIENSEQFQASGFAKGNFNYRVEQLGVNFVGTGIRDCARSAAPASCYANGNVQYSIEHLGPFFVRNHLGDDVEVKIFDGRIEHARGLATERYLTNPVSSSDRSLLEPYTRNEFQGRPLGGEYVLRVWDSPEVNFDRIEDVQFFLRYRYWTRQD